MSTAAVEAVSLFRFFHAGPEETLALRGVTLVVTPGEIVVIAGPSGSGKSTLMSCISGLDDPSGGSVQVTGQVMSRRPEAERAALRRDRIGILSQSSALFGHLTVAQNVALAQCIPSGRKAEYAHALPALTAMALAGIDHRADSYPPQLSGGETVRAGLAVALANSPAVLLADEPTGELDQATEKRLLDLFRTLAADGMAIILASHSPAVLAVADRVVHLTDGVVTSDER